MTRSVHALSVAPALVLNLINRGHERVGSAHGLPRVLHLFRMSTNCCRTRLSPHPVAESETTRDFSSRSQDRSISLGSWGSTESSPAAIEPAFGTVDNVERTKAEEGVPTTVIDSENQSRSEIVMSGDVNTGERDRSPSIVSVGSDDEINETESKV